MLSGLSLYLDLRTFITLGSRWIMEVIWMKFCIIEVRVGRCEIYFLIFPKSRDSYLKASLSYFICEGRSEGSF